jgi:hypothetical protein
VQFKLRCRVQLVAEQYQRQEAYHVIYAHGIVYLWLYNVNYTVVECG